MSNLSLGEMFYEKEIYVKQLQDEINTKKDIIIVDRSINDRQIWNDNRYKKNDTSEEFYKEY